MNLKKKNIKNDDIMDVDNINVDRILLDKKSYKNILVYDILNKKVIDANPLRIRFNKVDGIIMKKVVLQIVLILQESELIHIVLYL